MNETISLLQSLLLTELTEITLSNVSMQVNKLANNMIDFCISHLPLMV